MVKPIEEKHDFNSYNEVSKPLFTDDGERERVCTVNFQVILSMRNGKVFAIIKDDKYAYIVKTTKYIISNTEEDIRELRDAVEKELRVKFLHLILINDMVDDEINRKNTRKQVNKACKKKVF